MTHNEFIKTLQKALNEEGIRLSQDKLKKIFEVLADVVVDNIKEEEDIKIKEFIIFRLIEIMPKKMPDQSFSPQQLSMKIEMTDKFKSRLKKRLNNK